MGVILVAVSNGAVRASIAVGAHEGGHAVHSVADAGELVEAVEQKKPDLLFLDPGLARMDTVEPLKSLRILGHLARMRVVLVDDRCAELAAWASAARQLGDGVLDSFRKDDVHRAVDSLLGLGRMPAAPAPPPVPAPPASSLATGKTMSMTRTMLLGGGLLPRPGGAVPPPPPPPPMPARPASRAAPTRVPGVPTAVPAASAPVPPAAPAAPPGRRILIVEDTPSLRVLLGIKFESAGWRVSWAASAEEALGKVETEGCDVCLSDINLPGMSGDQLILTIRKQWPGVTLLLMTGLPPEKRPKVPAGIPIFGKPLDMEAVLRVIEKAVKPARS